MKSNRVRRVAACTTFAAAASVLAVSGGSPVAGGTPVGSIATGPSTTVDPFVLPSADGVSVTSLFTVDDLPATNGYEWVGIPDGLGAIALDPDQPIDAPGNRVVVHANHELGTSAGVTRAHGENGSFVSRLMIDPNNLEVRHGKDLISFQRFWDRSDFAYGPTPNNSDPGDAPEYGRFCSSTQAPIGSLFDADSGKGTEVPLYFTGEEIGDEGRAFVIDERGVTYELPRLGRLSFENVIPAEDTGERTVVMGMGDSGSNGRISMYVGYKQAPSNSANAFAFAAGLTNGRNYSLVVPGAPTDDAFRAVYGTGNPVAIDWTDVGFNQSGADQKAEAQAEGALFLDRVEDGVFDPQNPNDFYFVTTANGEGVGTGGGGGLWRIRYDDVTDPLAGGTLELLLDGSEGIDMNSPDNIGIDGNGNLLIQEDPGGSAVLARIIAYRTSDGALGTVATFDPARFDPVNIGNPEFLTTNEESSGIIDTEPFFGPGTFLFDAQAHTAAGLSNPAAQVENGQLLLLEVDDWDAVYEELELTVLHFNDGESKLLPVELPSGSGELYGGAAYMKSKIDEERALAASTTDGSLLVTSGDNYLASPEFQFSLDNGTPFVDSLILDEFDVDAFGVGNHEFDFGTQVLADFIPPINSTFLTANLDFSAVPELDALVTSGDLAASAVYTVAGVEVGVVGATTDGLALISSPGATIINPVAPAVQAEIDALEAAGVDNIVFISHLQGLSEDRDLLPQLDGVDVAIAGGGSELLANPGDVLAPGQSPVLPYPIFETGADGSEIPVVTTSGDYQFLGRLVVTFDEAGKVLEVGPQSGPQLVAAQGPTGVTPDATVDGLIAPVAAFVAGLDSTVIGTTEVELNGSRVPGVRSQETPLGNLMADALRWQASQVNGPRPDADVALQNGGGIRNSNQAAGPGATPADPVDVTLGDTFRIAPFANFVTQQTLTHQEFADLLEHGVDNNGGGAWGNWSGVSFEWDRNNPANGRNVINATLDGGTPLIVNGVVQTPAATLEFATIDFLARGGDGYPVPAGFTVLGVSYQQALANFISDAAGLNGSVTVADYPDIPKPQPIGTGNRMIPLS